jgi:hypothetical protein
MMYTRVSIFSGLRRAMAAALLLGVSGCAPYTTETLIVRELSVRTFSSTLNDDRDHPVMVIDNLGQPKPIGPGRGAGTWVFLNNKLVDYDSGAEIGVSRGLCWTVNHGKEPWKGKLWAGVGGPYDSACQFSYMLPDGQLVANGDLDMNQVEQDVPATISITGGTGRYRGVIGEVTIQQDPPGQPITYKLTLSLDVRRPRR